MDKKKPLIVGHRGASGYMPENSIAAYRLAFEMGADYVEPDIQLTADGEIVSIHDDTLFRTTNAEALFTDDSRISKGLVREFTLAELKKLTVDINPKRGLPSAYKKFESGKDGYKIPTLAELIDIAREYESKDGKKRGLFIEIKDTNRAIIDGIVHIFKEKGYGTAADAVYIQSFDMQLMFALKERFILENLHAKLVYISTPVMDNSTAYVKTPYGEIPLSRLAESLDGVNLKKSHPLSEFYIKQAHALGLEVYAWTFRRYHPENSLREYWQYMDKNLDGFLSNYPDIALKASLSFTN